MAPRQVVIVGGGFAGAALAVHLRRQATDPVAITIVEPRERVGLGLAYGTEDPAHRINVPSDKMTVLEDDPTAFTSWLERTGRRAADPGGEDGFGAHYSRRADFGAFMADLLQGAVIPLTGNVTHLRDTAVAVRPKGTGADVALASGKTLRADRVVLALSHDRPALPFQTGAAVTGHPGFHADPWDTRRLGRIAAGDKVVVLGTGLTMVDVVTGLLARGHRGPIVALSRRGLLPQRHGAFSPVVSIPAAERPRTAAAALALARRAVREEEAAGRGWHTGVDGVRRAAERLWRGLPVDEQARALRRLRAFWDVHRYRIAPQLAQAIESARAREQLSLVTAAVTGLEATEQGILEVRIRASDGRRRSIECHSVVCCLGPCADVTRRAAPLLRELMDTGRAQPDAHRLGLLVDTHHRLIDREGRADPRLRAVGPLTRGVFWEVVGVPELSEHCKRLADDLTNELAPLALQPAAS